MASAHEKRKRGICLLVPVGEIATRLRGSIIVVGMQKAMKLTYDS